jgi:hypothetical protein
MPRLSEQARKNKVAYNMQRNKEIYGKFQALIPKEEYKLLCDYLKSIGMNKAEFIRWAFDKIRED